MNATILRFGYPQTLVADYRHWVVLLRPDQPTVGSLILAAKSEATEFGALDAEAFAELATVVPAIEGTLRGLIDPARLNYLMLMMVDRNVHYHVIPRYEGTRSLGGIALEDKGWPKLPSLGDAIALDPDQIAALAGVLKERWPQAAGRAAQLSRLHSAASERAASRSDG